MKRFHIFIITLLMIISAGCSDVLDTKWDINLTDQMASQRYQSLASYGYASYAQVSNGFTALDNNILDAITDDAEQTKDVSNAMFYNNGSWNAFNNPLDNYAKLYTGIRYANFFLENSLDYQNFLAYKRDTMSDDQVSYKRDIQDIAWLRNEARVLRAYYYSELIKRYGDVPLITKVLAFGENADIARTSYDDVVDYIVSEIDAVKGDLQVNWKTFDISKDGRITRDAAVAIKARTLLYAASPLHNPSNDKSKWQAAVAAAHDIIATGLYSIDNGRTYQNLFAADGPYLSNESIWTLRLGTSNAFERSNYPIETVGGNSGVTPSQNLVLAYEYKGAPDPANPYANRDPRLGYTVVVNNSTWTGRKIEIWEGGKDDRNQPNTSKTGYYLKKFLDSNLNLEMNQVKTRNWFVFRYAEILLDYAEAMNEANGPDADPNGWGMTARQAVNAVRSRASVGMPDVVAADQAEMRDKIKRERRIELAFEGHRYWDLLRWKDAETALNQPLKGIKIDKNPDGTFAYTEFTVEPRVFTAPKMYLFPILQTEISKSNGILTQNPEW